MTRQTSQQIFLMDTHVWVWLMNGSPELRSSKFHKALEQKGHSFSLRASILSVWEIGMLEAKGRIVFPMGAMKWVEQAEKAPHFGILPLTSEIAIQSCQLPGSFHGDPADRMIVATAKSVGAILVTRDERILAYCHKYHLETLKA